MLPAFEICQRKIAIFNQKHPHSTFDDFWRYKLEVESSAGSILDDSHLDETTTCLVKNLLLRDEWELWKTGVSSFEKIKEILKNIRDDYKIMKDIQLGDGRVAHESVRNVLCRIYAGFHMKMGAEDWGITHNCHQHDSPDSEGRYFVLGRSKVLMFIWGQTPGFDTNVRRRLSKAGLSSYPWIEAKRWKPLQFCDIMKELDRWVAAWNEKNGKEEGTFERLSSNRPAGRIIDIIYWTRSGDCRPEDVN